jgi:hypothetical protein
MKRTPPVGMGYVDSSKVFGYGMVKPIPSVTYDWEHDDKADALSWPIPETLTRPEVAITIGSNKGKMIVLESKVRALLPASEKYEWQVAAEYDLRMDSTRLGLRLMNAHVPRDPKDHIDIYAVHDVYHLDQLVSNDAYLKAVIDKLVGSLVRELARIEKEKLHGLQDQAERQDSQNARGSRLVREGKASSPKVSASDDETSQPLHDAGAVGLHLSQSYGSGSVGLSDPASSVSVTFDSGTGGDFSGGGGGTDW